MDRQRQSWRDRLAARKAAPAMPRTAGVVEYAAAVATPGAGGRPAVRDLGHHGSLSAAQAACQGSAQASGVVLDWRPRDSRSWGASAPGAAFVVSIGTK
jgi:hypothetical protein